MANKKIYEVEVAGTERAVKLMQQFEETLVKDGAEAAQKIAKQFNTLADQIQKANSAATSKAADTSFLTRGKAEWSELFSGGADKAADRVGAAMKSLSRDIDAVGGQAAAAVTSWISNVQGVISAVVGSPILGTISAIATAVGSTVLLVSKWKEEEQELIKKADELRKAEEVRLQFIKDEAVAIAQRRKAAQKDSLESQAEALELRAIGLKAVADAQILALRAAEENAERLRTAGRIGVEASKERDRLSLEATKAVEAAKTAEREASAKKAEALEWASLEFKAQAGLDDLEAEKARKERLLAYYQQFTERAKEFMITPGTLLAGIVNDAEEEAWKQKVASMDRAVKENTAKVHEQNVQAANDIKDQVSLWESWGGLIEDVKDVRQEMLNQEMRDQPVRAASLMAMTEQSRAYVVQRSNVMQLSEALKQLNINEQAVNGATMALGVTSLVVDAMMQPLMATLQAYGTINRENWRDLLSFNEDFRNNMAAQVQIALWGLAQQAAGKSVFEAGEGFREQAQALGAAATGNFVSAGLHQTSAMMHFVARDAYAGIAGVSAGASIGVGMQRGEGGLFGLTKEERERRDRERASGGGPAAEGPTVRGIGGGQGPGAVVVNFVYEAGAIDARSRDAAAATVAASAREARRDGFLRRRMAAG